MHKKINNQKNPFASGDPEELRDLITKLLHEKEPKEKYFLKYIKSTWKYIIRSSLF